MITIINNMLYYVIIVNHQNNVIVESVLSVARGLWALQTSSYGSYHSSIYNIIPTQFEYHGQACKYKKTHSSITID